MDILETSEVFLNALSLKCYKKERSKDKLTLYF